jgi:hypothetical protein
MRSLFCQFFPAMTENQIQSFARPSIEEAIDMMNVEAEASDKPSFAELKAAEKKAADDLYFSAAGVDPSGYDFDINEFRDDYQTIKED